MEEIERKGSVRKFKSKRKVDLIKEALEENETADDLEENRSIEEDKGAEENGENHLHRIKRAIEGKPIINRELLKKRIVEKALAANEKEDDEKENEEEIPLGFLSDLEKNNVFIGRKKSVFQKYGYDGALLVGCVEEEEHSQSSVFLDSLNPHVIFVCGARGSGKSYVLGVIAEELALKNQNVGTIVVDPVGVFWSMRLPNKDEREIKSLADWELIPQGLKNLRVFIPKGLSESVPKTTFDSTFSIQPSLLTVEDWCLTFGIERFSPSGLLMEKALRKLETGYKNTEGKIIEGKKKSYSIDDIAECIENDAELSSKERGFKQDSIRALCSRFESAKNWGIFDKKGTPLSELSRKNQLTILDTSFLEENVTALVIGLLARRLLAARKICTRKEAVKRMKTESVDYLLETDIPPTWLLIDEAHTLLPSGNQSTPASKGLIEYVKQGRRPGCSLVFATQQPSAIDSKVLSQLDILLSHKLVFDDDIKAIYKRIPSLVPNKLKKTSFIRSLPIGIALTADRREETSRAFVMKIRPRMSQHEGRDTETSELNEEEWNESQVKDFAIELIQAKIRKEGEMDLGILRQLLSTLNSKHSTKLGMEELAKTLKENQIMIEGEKLFSEKKSIGREKAIKEQEIMEQYKEIPMEEKTSESTELIALTPKISLEKATRIAQSMRKKKMLGLMGKEEKVTAITTKFETIWKILFDYYASHMSFVQKECYISSISGEFVQYKRNDFIESAGLKQLYEKSDAEIKVIQALIERKKTLEKIMEQTELKQTEIEATIENLLEAKIINQKGNDFELSKEIDLPNTPTHSLLESLKELPMSQAEVLEKIKENYSQQKITKTLHLLWPSIVVRKITPVFKPYYEAVLESENQSRRIFIDGITGTIYETTN